MSARMVSAEVEQKTHAIATAVCDRFQTLAAADFPDDGYEEDDGVDDDDADDEDAEGESDYGLEDESSL